MATRRRGLVCSVVVGLAALLVPAVGTPVSASAASQVDRAALVQQWFDARSGGDVNGMLGLMADTAVYIAGACQPQSPCTGDQIRATAEATAAVHSRFTISNVQVVGSNVQGRYEMRSDTVCAAGVERIVGTFLISVPQDKLALYVAMVDQTDAQTATNLAVAAGRQPAGPRPAGCS